jgi:hypothetical protein
LQYLINYSSFKVEEGEKMYEATFQKLASLSSNLKVCNHQIGHNKKWIQGLQQQIHLISNGTRVTIDPLLIKSPNNMPLGKCDRGDGLSYMWFLF